MRLEEPVPLHRRQSGGVVELSTIRRDEGELARIARDAGSLAASVDGLGELDSVAPGPAGRGAGSPIRPAAEEVRKLFVEQRLPLVRQVGKSRIADEQVRVVRPHPVAPGEAGEPSDDAGSAPAGARGQGDEAAGVPSCPLRHLLADRLEVGVGPRVVEVLLLDERESANAVWRAGEGGGVLLTPRGEGGGRVWEAGELVPGAASRRFRVPGKHRHDVERRLPVEQRRAREGSVVEVRLEDEDRAFREAPP